MVPSFQKFMLPYLDCLSDGSPRTNKQLMAYCAQRLNLTEEDKSERTKGGNATKYQDRTTWAGTYLRKAGCVESKKRGEYIITQRGKDLLTRITSDITIETLEQYDEFLDFVDRKSVSNIGDEQFGLNHSNVEKTPTEIMMDAYNELSDSLAEELLGEVKSQSPQFFEKLVVKLLVAMGYGGSFEDAASVTQYSHDEGIDGVIKEDKLGLDNIYVQAKRYDKGPIGRKEIQSFVGALSGKGATKGIFITTSTFTREAKEFKPLSNIKIVLMDGKQLCDHMIEYNIGVSTRQIYEVKKIDSDFFDEE